jgi:hypothetical protein
MRREKQSGDRVIGRSDDLANGGTSRAITSSFTRSSDLQITRSIDLPIRLTLTERRLYVFA